ncbi:hypothetical protein Mapa_005535 [Marchantia paleacea]|nr:hypothetical protein Mapa_005535 [Marchantia paleacea]
MTKMEMDLNQIRAAKTDIKEELAGEEIHVSRVSISCPSLGLTQDKVGPHSDSRSTSWRAAKLPWAVFWNIGLSKLGCRAGALHMERAPSTAPSHHSRPSVVIWSH